jgi:hypothetical protein
MRFARFTFLFALSGLLAPVALAFPTDGTGCAEFVTGEAKVNTAYFDVLELLSRGARGERIDEREIVEKMETLLGLPPTDSLYGPEGFLDLFLGQDGRQYRIYRASPAEVMANLFAYLKQDPSRIAITKNHATLFHGSNSSSLLAFTAYGNFSGDLLPLGELERANRVPFSGEIIDGRNGINAENLSTAFITHAGIALRYAREGHFSSEKALRDLGGLFKEYADPAEIFTPPRILAFMKAEKAVGSDLSHDPEALLTFLEKMAPHLSSDEKHFVEISVKRIREFQKLSPLERSLVTESFPVLYGIHPLRTGVASAARAIIPGEVLLKGGAKLDEIRVIYVPEEKRALVRTLLESVPGSEHIAVEPLSRAYPIQRLGTSDQVLPERIAR